MNKNLIEILIIYCYIIINVLMAVKTFKLFINKQH